MHLNTKINNHLWGPPGRFIWKLHNFGNSSPFTQIVKYAETQGSSWLPLKAGFFDGSIDKFKEIVTSYLELIPRRGWY
jgi:hypothetical protein